MRAIRYSRIYITNIKFLKSLLEALLKALYEALKLY